MRIFFCILFLTASLTSLTKAFAQTVTSSALLSCNAKENSIERLACYDALAKKFAPSIESKTTSIGEWKVSTDFSKFDDTKSVYLFLEARNSISGWPGKKYTPKITIRCKEKKTEAYITFGMSPSVESGLYNEATLQLRVDKQPSFKLVATKSTDGEALFIKDAISFSKKLFKGGELLVRFIPFNSSAQEVSFNIINIELAIVPLQQACMWPK